MAAPNDRRQDSSRRRRFSGMFVFPRAAQSSAPQRVRSYFDIPIGAASVNPVEFANGKKAKSVIKTSGLTLKLKPEAPLKDFQSFFLPN